MFHTSARDQGKSGRGTVEPRKRRRWQLRPTVVVLEDRRLLSTFTVTNNATSGAGSLPYEIGLANTAGGANTIVFGSFFNTPQTITLGGTQLELSTANESVTIKGPNKGVMVSGGGASRVFQVDASVSASISGLTITGGTTPSGSFGTTTGDGGGLANFGTTTLNNCAISGNSAAYDGGGVSDDGTLTMTNCTVSGNSAVLGGGGVFNANSGTATLTNCTVSGNSTTGNAGGGVYNKHMCDPDRLHRQRQLRRLRRRRSGHRRRAYQGDINISGTTTLTNCTVSGNSAGNSGGGVANFIFSGGEGPFIMIASNLPSAATPPSPAAACTTLAARPR